ncbi:MAG: hypothetical protein JKY37_32825 [Nannocystaceae bacterium]|nr:hypothetical protein [Nannocystaceae bacterium]
MRRINDELLDMANDGSGDALFEGALFTGIAVEHLPTGELVSEVAHRDGKRHGPSREWFSNGKLETEQYFRLGARHGTWREWDKQGALTRDDIWEYFVPVFRRDPKAQSTPEDGTSVLASEPGTRKRWQQVRARCGPEPVTELVDDEFVDMPWPFDDRLPEELRTE